MRRYVTYLFLIALLTGCQVTFNDPFDGRGRFTGDYRVEEYSQSTNESFRYNISIDRSLDFNDEVIIRNFYDAGIDVFAFVDGDKIFIDRQINGSFEIEGVGTRRGGRVELDYIVRDITPGSNFTDFLSATAFK